MSGDIHRVGAATHHMVEFAATLLVIAAQIIIAFVIAPLLTAVALFLIAIGAAVGFVMLRRAHDFGARLSHMGIALMHETAQFLGGLKLAPGKIAKPISSPNFRTVSSGSRASSSPISARRIATGSPPPSLAD